MRTIYIIPFLLFIACDSPKTDPVDQVPDENVTKLSDEELLDTIQYYTFQYFWDGAEPNSGMAPERIHMDGVYPANDAHVITTGGTGMGLIGILGAIDRGWISRVQAAGRFEKILNFLEKADRYGGRRYSAWRHIPKNN